jgi:hypothetical protein
VVLCPLSFGSGPVTAGVPVPVGSPSPSQEPRLSRPSHQPQPDCRRIVRLHPRLLNQQVRRLRHPPPPQGNSSTSPSTSLSTNTAIGIGVGLGVGLAAMAFGWFLLWRHYRRRRSSDSTPDEHRYADKSSKTILAEVMTKEVGPTELAISSSKYYEAPGRNQEPQELYAGTPTQYHSRSVWTG